MAETIPPLSELVSWLYGMHKASASMYDAIKSYAENTKGFYAEELQKAVFSTERSGTDIYTAVSSVSESTKNPAFQKFLSEYLTTVKTSGNPESYLEKKLEGLRSEEKADEEKRASSLAVFAEIFVSVFVAGILFAVIVFLILGIISGGSPLPLAAVVYGILPLGTAGFLLVLDMLYPSLDMEEIRKKRKKERTNERASIKRAPAGETAENSPFRVSDAYGQLTAEEQAVRKKLGTYDRNLRLRRFLHHPAAELLKKPYLVFIFSAPPAVSAGLLLCLAAHVPPRFAISSALLICFVPYAVFSLIRRKNISAAEAEFPSVCRIISSAADRGLPLSKCLASAAAENNGVLKPELEAAVRDISFGGGVYLSLFRFAERLPFPSAKRTILFAAECGHFSGNAAPPFRTGADAAAHSLSLRSGQKSEMQLYVLIMYISYFVFIFVQFILSGVFIDAVSAANTAADTGLYLGILTDAVLIHGVCCGLAAGKMSGGGISSGIFHACVLLAAGLAASAAVWIL